MCGRFTLVADLSEVMARFHIPAVGDGWDDAPQYNIAPSQDVWAIVQDGKENRMGKLRWGLIPHWAKDMAIGHKMINARAETLAEKPSFKRAFRRRRCLIPADGFFEWRETAAGKKPVRVRLRSGELFAFAGLWERWVADDGKEVTSCAIVTTEANALLRDIHPRMPVILRREAEAVWLDRTIQDTSYLQDLLVPYPSEAMDVYDVSPVVNSARNNTPECIQPV